MQLSLDDDKNVRKGLFGTALRDGDDVKFKVSFGFVRLLFGVASVVVREGFVDWWVLTVTTGWRLLTHV